MVNHLVLVSNTNQSPSEIQDRQMPRVFPAAVIARRTSWIDSLQWLYIIFALLYCFHLCTLYLGYLGCRCLHVYKIESDTKRVQFLSLTFHLSHVNWARIHSSLVKSICSCLLIWFDIQNPSIHCGPSCKMNVVEWKDEHTVNKYAVTHPVCC